jgi:high-affinity Fe2+/Pb2+ permease
VRPRGSVKWLTVGSVVAGAGAALAVGYWIYVLTVSQSFWRIPGIIGIGLAAAGGTLLLIGVFATDENRGTSQSIRAGDQSTNIQVVGDALQTGKDDDPKR